jgi:hypothetical protein
MEAAMSLDATHHPPPEGQPRRAPNLPAADDALKSVRAAWVPAPPVAWLSSPPASA